MGLWDSITSGLSSAGNWIGRNNNWIGPAANLGMGLYGLSQQQRYQNQYQNYLRQQEQNNYNQAENYRNAYNEAAGEEEAAAEEDKAAAAAAIAEALPYLKPYLQAGEKVLPLATDMYSQSIGKLGDLYRAFLTPEQIALVNQNVPAYGVQIGNLPEHMKKGY